jgi:GTP-binding protein HflX
LTEDRLFSTLDSTVRKYELPSGRSILLSDTVGFVRRLPHHLIEAFRSTLDQVKEADLLLHLVDASDPDPERQIDAVRTVLSEIEAGHLPEIIVINKADQADPATLKRLANLHPNAVVISALTGEGIHNLADVVGTTLDADRTVVRLEVPYARGDIVAAAHAEGEVVAEKHDDSGTIIDVRLPQSRIKAFAEFQVS